MFHAPRSGVFYAPRSGVFYAPRSGVFYAPRSGVFYAPRSGVFYAPTGNGVLPGAGLQSGNTTKEFGAPKRRRSQSATRKSPLQTPFPVGD